MKLFVNGKLVADASVKDGPLDVSTEAPLRIGFGPNSQFQGKLRNVRLYNRAVSDAEIGNLAK
jgi:hypothetical protein